MTTQKQRATEARKAYRDVRHYAAMAMTMIEHGTLARAYVAAQSAYEAAFDARAIIAGDLERYDAAVNAPQYPPAQETEA